MDFRLSSLGKPRQPFIAALAATLIFSSLVIAERYGVIELPHPTHDLIASVLPGAVVALTNDERQQQGLGTLHASALLNRAAQMKADDMAAKGYYAHISPDGTIPPYWLNAVGYKYQIMGENLVVDRDNSEQVVSAWMGSESHRENILNPAFTEIGVGVAYGKFKGRDTIYVVQMLARPLIGSGNPSPTPVRTTTPAPIRTPAPRPVPILSEVLPKIVPNPAPPKELVRAPAPKPVVRDPIAPILTTISSSTLVEVPSIVASTTYAPPALGTDTSEPVDLVPLEPLAQTATRPTLREQVRSFVNAVGRSLRDFLTL